MKLTKCLIIFSFITSLIPQNINSQIIKFYQFDINLDSVIQINSDWGGMEVKYDSFPGSMYINLSIDAPGITTQWQIQNVLVSKQGSDSDNVLIYFDIGDTSVEVGNLNYGYSITPYPINTPPEINSTAVVYNSIIVINSGLFESVYDKPGIEELLFDNEFEKAVPTIGGEAEKEGKIDNNFRVNQEAGKNECVPAALSNSVKFLNNLYQLGIPAWKTSIEFMKYACAFTNNGVPLNFPDIKRNWFALNNIPITTREYKPPLDLNKIICELNDNQDVEITVQRLYPHWLWGTLQKSGHTAQISGITDIGDGYYEFEISHDRNQNEPGGRQRDFSIYDTRTNSFISGIFKKYNLGIYHIVVECPAFKSSCYIEGPDIIALNSNANFKEMNLKSGFWTISNITANAAINWQNDSVASVNAGNTGGTFKLYYTKYIYTGYDTCFNIFCDKYVTVDDPLPVELNSFTYQTDDNNVFLRWITGFEINNKGFEIERSTDDNIWLKIGFIKESEFSNSSNIYSFNDNNLISGTYYYRLKQIDNNGNFKYYNLNSAVIIGSPVKYMLSQNYPNPFNSETRIGFGIPKAGNVEIKLYDVSGREVKILINEYKPEGFYNINFNVSNFTSGIYFYRFASKNYIEIRKMVVIK